MGILVHHMEVGTLLNASKAPIASLAKDYADVVVRCVEGRNYIAAVNNTSLRSEIGVTGSHIEDSELTNLLRSNYGVVILNF